MARFVFGVCLLVSIYAVLPARGQVGIVNNTTSTPVHGAGHDYIQALAETVNPANGSLSVRVAGPVPPARGITVPYFLFTYDSNIPFGGSTPVLQPEITTSCSRPAKCRR